MIFVSFERGESHLLIDSKIDKFDKIDRKLDGNLISICTFKRKEKK